MGSNVRACHVRTSKWIARVFALPEGYHPVLQDGNEDLCGACKGLGTLICCERCPAAFHAECAGYGEPRREPACSRNPLVASLT